MSVADVGSMAACSSPGLPPAWSQPGHLEPLPWLRDAAAALLCAHSTSSRAEHPRAPHRQGHSSLGMLAGCAQCATDEVWLSTAPVCRTRTKHKLRQSGLLPPFQLGQKGTGGSTHTLTLMDLSDTSTSCLFQLQAGHTETLGLCIGCVEAQNPAMAHSST